MENIHQHVDIYTDGACKGNPGAGGWAFITIENDTIIHKQSGHEKHTTNNRMELTAVMKALQYMNMYTSRTNVASCVTSCKFHIDSKYVLNGIVDWVHKWKKNNWKTSTKSPVLNDELWKEIDIQHEQLREHVEIEWIWVKGHSNNKYNDVVDTLASDASMHAK
jgi:ribonuclease HI